MEQIKKLIKSIERKHQLSFLLSQILLQSTQYIWINSTSNISSPFYLLINELTSNIIDLIILKIMIISIISSILLLFWKIKNFNVQYIELFYFPIVIYFCSIKIKDQNLSKVLKILYIMAIIIIEIITILKIIFLKIRYPPKLDQNYARVSYFRSALLIIKINILIFFPIFLNQIYVVGIAAAISFIKTVLYFQVIQRENQNIQYMIGMGQLWQWYSLGHYFLILGNIQSSYSSILIALILFYLVINKPKWVKWCFEKKYTYLFHINKNYNQYDTIIMLNIIINQYDNNTPQKLLGWSQQFKSNLTDFLIKTNMEITSKNILLDQSLYLQTITNLSQQKRNKINTYYQTINQNINSKFLFITFQQIIKKLKSQSQQIDKLIIFLCENIRIKSNQQKNKIFYYYYRQAIHSQYCINNFHFDLCYNYLKPCFQTQRAYDNFIKLQQTINKIIQKLSQFLKNQKIYFEIMTIQKKNQNNLQNYLIKKNQIRKIILQLIQQYQIYDQGKIKSIIISCIIFKRLQYNTGLVDKYWQELRNLQIKFFKFNQGINISDIYLDDKMVCLCSGTKTVGKIIISNSYFKDVMEIKCADLRKSQSQYNINDFLMKNWREDHQKLMNNFLHLKNLEHNPEKCFLLSKVGQHCLNVTINIITYCHNNRQLMLFVIMKLNGYQKYLVLDDNSNVIFQSKNYVQENSLVEIFSANLRAMRKCSIIGQYQLEQQSYPMTIFNKRYFIQKQKSNDSMNKGIFQQFTKQVSDVTKRQISIFHNNSLFNYCSQKKLQQKQKYFQIGIKTNLLFQSSLIKILIFFIIAICFYLASLVSIDNYFNNIRIKNIQLFKFQIALQQSIYGNQQLKPIHFFIYQKLNNHLSFKTSELQNLIIQSIKNTVLQNYKQTSQLLLQARENKLLLDIIFNKVDFSNHQKNQITLFNDISSLYSECYDYLIQIQKKQQNITKILQTLYSDDKKLTSRYLNQQGFIPKFSQLLNIQIKKSQLQTNISTITFFSLLIISLVILFIIIYKIKSNIIKFIDLPLNFDKKVLNSIKWQNQNFQIMIQKLNQKSIQTLSSQIIIQVKSLKYQKNTSQQMKKKILKNQKRSVIKSQKLFFIVIGILVIIIIGIFLYDWYQNITNRENMIKYEKTSFQITLFSTYASQCLKILLFQHMGYLQTNTSKIYSNLFNKITASSSLSILHQILTIDEFNNLLFEDLCSQIWPWQCQQYHNNDSLKVQINSLISKVRQLGYNLFVPAHMNQQSTSLFIQTYKQILSMNKQLDFVQKYIKYKFNKQSIETQHLKFIKYSTIILFSLIFSIKIILTMFKCKIYQDQIFRMTSFRILQDVQPYKYYINYFYQNRKLNN